MVDTSISSRPAPPKEQWVYVSDWAWPLLSEWDTAFEAVVQAAYTPSALNQTRLFFAQCRKTASFLCGVWGVRAPTLMHFLVEDSPPKLADMDRELIYPSVFWKLRPVTVRIVELPLKRTYTGLSADVFLGRKQQMLSIMRGDKLYEQFEPWDESDQLTRRFQEYMDDNFYDRKETLMFYLGKADGWMTEHVEKPLGLKEAIRVVYALSFFGTGAIAKGLILMPLNWVKESFRDYFGYPKRGDQILGAGFRKNWNPWDDLTGMSDALSRITENLANKAQEKEDLEKGSADGKMTSNWRSGSTPSAETAATSS
jgi:hypothetical protein